MIYVHMMKTKAVKSSSVLSIFDVDDVLPLTKEALLEYLMIYSETPVSLC